MLGLPRRQGVRGADQDLSDRQLHLTATVDSVPFAADLNTLELQSQPPDFYVVHGRREVESREINVTFTYDLANGTFPADVTGTAQAVVEYVECGSGVNIWRASSGNGTFSIHLTSASGGRLRGTMTAASMPRVLELGDFEVIIP